MKLLVLSLPTIATAFVVSSRGRAAAAAARKPLFSGATISTQEIVKADLKALLEGLDGPDGGPKLLQASSPKWRKAILEALGAPITADESNVAKALQHAMSRENNQFAILMGKEEKFVAQFPSDFVMDDKTCWAEVQLRDRDSDELLVTMGVSLNRDEDGSWKISALDWQDFRDAYYPGLSGREWLRAF